MQETLFHSYSDNICAYCNLHACGITVKQMKRKQCLQKQCNHLTKNETHQIWRQRDRAKALRKARKLSRLELIS